MPFKEIFAALPVDLAAQVKSCLIRKYGKLGHPVFLAGTRLADALEVNQALLPIGALVLVNGKLEKVTYMTSLSIYTNGTAKTCSEITLLETKEVTVDSINRDGFVADGIEVTTDNLARAYVALINTSTIIIYKDKDVWKF